MKSSHMIWLPVMPMDVVVKDANMGTNKRNSAFPVCLQVEMMTCPVFTILLSTKQESFALAVGSQWFEQLCKDIDRIYKKSYATPMDKVNHPNCPPCED